MYSNLYAFQFKSNKSNNGYKGSIVDIYIVGGVNAIFIHIIYYELAAT